MWLRIYNLLLDPQQTGSFAQNSFQIESINSCSTSKKLQFWLKIIIFFPLFFNIIITKGKLCFIVETMKKKMLDSTTSQKSQERNIKPWYLYYYSASWDSWSFKRSREIHLSSSNWFKPLFSCQNWTNTGNIQKKQ